MHIGKRVMENLIQFTRLHGDDGCRTVFNVENLQQQTHFNENKQSSLNNSKGNIY